MEIGLIAPPWVPVPPPAYGGTEAVVDRLARGLDAAGHDVLLAAAGNSTCPVPQVTGSKHAAAGAPAVGDSAEEMRYLLNAYTQMRDCDLIHDHTVIGPMMWQWHPHPSRTTTVSTFHQPVDRRFAPLYEVQGYNVYAIAISENQAAKARAEGIGVDTVIHHGIDVDDIPQGAGKGGYASFLGRMSPDKGVQQAITIARLAGVPLMIGAKIREPAERAYYRDVIKPLLSPTIQYLGELDADEKYALLGGSFAMLKPDQWDEPFGLVTIEALACGTPVVGVPRGAMSEIVDEGVTGFLRWGNGRMATALTAAAGLDRDVCRAQARARFDSSCMVERHLEFYARITKEGQAE